MSDPIYDDGGVHISASLVRIGTETFSTPNITAVRVEAAVSLPLRVGTFVGGGWLLVGGLMQEGYAAAAVGAFFVGLALLVTKSNLVIATAGGERRALVDSAKRCQAIAAAIAKANARARSATVASNTAYRQRRQARAMHRPRPLLPQPVVPLPALSDK